MPLVGKICKADIASQLSPDDVSHVTGSLRSGLGVFGCDGLRCGSGAIWHWVASLNLWRYRFAVGHLRRAVGRWGLSLRRCSGSCEDCEHADQTGWKAERKRGRDGHEVRGPPPQSIPIHQKQRSCIAIRLSMKDWVRGKGVTMD